MEHAKCIVVWIELLFLLAIYIAECLGNHWKCSVAGIIMIGRQSLVLANKRSE